MIKYIQKQLENHKVFGSRFVYIEKKLGDLRTRSPSSADY